MSETVTRIAHSLVSLDPAGVADLASQQLEGPFTIESDARVSLHLIIALATRLSRLEAQLAPEK